MDVQKVVERSVLRNEAIVHEHIRRWLVAVAHRHLQYRTLTQLDFWYSSVAKHQLEYQPLGLGGPLRWR
jgi:hypothetical protein